MPILALLAFAYGQHLNLATAETKLATASTIHQLDTATIADLSKQLTDQNDAVTALQASQATKAQAVKDALAVAQAGQQKVVQLLAPTQYKTPVSCADAMPDVRSILKRLTQ
jgi:hypothetical protein